jgi:hypothetical protein
MVQLTHIMFALLAATSVSFAMRMPIPSPEGQQPDPDIQSIRWVFCFCWPSWYTQVDVLHGGRSLSSVNNDPVPTIGVCRDFVTPDPKETSTRT